MFLTDDEATKRAFEKEANQEFFVENPIKKGLIQTCDTALGRNMKRLASVSDLQSALSEEFWPFVTNLLDTWARLVEAFARQAVLVDFDEDLVQLLFRLLDYASAVMIHSLLCLDARGVNRDGKVSGADVVMKYLRRLQSFESVIGRELFPNAQAQFPCVLCEYKHQFQLLKTTALAKKYLPQQVAKTGWVQGALLFLPERRLSEDRQFLVRHYMNKLRKGQDHEGNEVDKRIKWDSVVVLELDLAESFKAEVRAASKRPTGLNELPKWADGKLLRDKLGDKNRREEHRDRRCTLLHEEQVNVAVEAHGKQLKVVASERPSEVTVRNTFIQWDLREEYVKETCSSRTGLPRWTSSRVKKAPGAIAEEVEDC